MDIDRDVASAVANCGTRVVFRVSDRDARELESGFTHFQASDLQNLNNFEAICRVGRSDADFNLVVPSPAPCDEDEATRMREEVIAVSRAKYARPRSEVEAELLRQWQTDSPEKQPAPTFPPAPAPTSVSEAVTGLKKPDASAQEAPPVWEKPLVKARSESPTPSAERPTLEPTSPISPEEAHDTDSLGSDIARKGPSDALPSHPPESGRGGAEHTAMQQQVKEIAEKTGFNAAKEETVLGGAGHVDVSLMADGLKVACEVSVSRSVASEIENVRKCIAAGYDAVIAIAREKRDVIALGQGFATAFSEEEARRIHVCQLRGVGALLKRMLRQTKKADSETARTGGYKIKRKYSTDLGDEDGRKIEADILEAIRRALRGESGR